MRLYNQTKQGLSWSMGGVSYDADPWGPVTIPEHLLDAVKSRGLPLGVAPIAPENRAIARVADERLAAENAPLQALKLAADAAEADARAAKEELGRVQVELGQARSELREAHEVNESLSDKLKRVTADKEAAEGLLADTAAQATAAEERAIKANALLAEQGGKAAEAPAAPAGKPPKNK